MKVFRFSLDDGEIAVPVSKIESVAVYQKAPIGPFDYRYSLRVNFYGAHFRIFDFNTREEALKKYKEIVEEIEKL